MSASAPPRGNAGRIVVRLLLLLFLLAAGVFAAFRFSPWPGALLVRREFDEGAKTRVAALAQHVPADVRAVLDEPYLPSEPRLTLDVFQPAEPVGTMRTTVVWIHGGGWVSGDKADVAPYLRILAARGFTVVGVNYTVAPEATHPTPTREVNAALGYLVSSAERLEVDPTRIVLAGDSGGAHVAAQLANAIRLPSYAATLGIEPTVRPSHLVGLVLFCGAYDPKTVNLDGPFGKFLRTVLWSYSGTQGFQSDERFAAASIPAYLTPDYPPVFLSAGNADPLLAQSRAFADALAAQGIPVDSLFFPTDQSPPLPHEYQFDLDLEAARLALDRAVEFVATR